MSEAVTLDPNDPFDAALIPIVLTNRKKRADYAKDGDPFSNFRDTSFMLGLDGFGAAESAFFNVLQKVARLKSLRQNGRMDDVQNEAVEYTYLDLAVYGVILYGIVIQKKNKIQSNTILASKATTGVVGINTANTSYVHDPDQQ